MLFSKSSAEITLVMHFSKSLNIKKTFVFVFTIRKTFIKKQLVSRTPIYFNSQRGLSISWSFLVAYVWISIHFGLAQIFPDRIPAPMQLKLNSPKCPKGANIYKRLPTLNQPPSPWIPLTRYFTSPWSTSNDN